MTIPPLKEPSASRLNETNLNNTVIALIYGPSGSFKTGFAGTAGDRTVFIDIGGGLNTLKSPRYRQDYKVNPIVVTLHEDDSGFYSANPKLFDDVTNALDFYLEKKLDEFDTIVIDDITNLRRAAMNKAIQVNNALGITKFTGLMEKHNTPIVGVAEYGREMSLITQFIAFYTDMCRAQHKNLIMCAHERLTYKKGDKVGDMPILQKVRPGFTGQTFPDEVTGYFDIVGHMEPKGEGDKYRPVMRLRSNSIVIAKSRWAGIVPDEWEKPNFLDLIAKVKTYTDGGKI